MKRLKRYTYERYAILCQLAYPNREGFELDFSGFEQIELLDRFKTSCVRVIWQADKKEVVVVFRGSHNLYDWLLNLCMFQTPLEFSGRRYFVHWGMQRLLQQPSYTKFDGQAKPLLQRIINILQPLADEGKKISFIGHSTGGSLAVLFADQFARKELGKVKRVVTFGQPSCGGASFKRHYCLHHKTYRVCCDVDIVTFLPPLPYLYQHVGKLLWLHEDRIYEHITPGTRLWISIKSWLLRPFAYHYMKKYIRNKGLFDKH